MAGDLESLHPISYDLMMDVNLRAPLLLTQLCTEQLKQSKGCIVNVSCEKGQRPEPGLLGYCMSKAGLEALTKTAALELAAFGVRVNCVAPCLIADTNLFNYASMDENEISQLNSRAAANTPQKRCCRAADVAKAIIFLTAAESSKITGHIMKVDGAKSLTSRGQQDWMGQSEMSRKFEQEASINNIFQGFASLFKPTRQVDEDSLVQRSNWSDQDPKLSNVAKLTKKV